MFISYQMPRSIYSSITSPLMIVGSFLIERACSKPNFKYRCYFAHTSSTLYIYLYELWIHRLYMLLYTSICIFYYCHVMTLTCRSCMILHLDTGERISFIGVLVLPQSEIKSVHVTPQVPKCERTVSLPQWIGRPMSKHAIISIYIHYSSDSRAPETGD